jgi:hypothetical protein
LGIVTLQHVRLGEAKLLIDELRRWVRSDFASDRKRELVRVLLEDKWSDFVNVGGSVLVIDEGGQESFDVTLLNLPVNEFLLASILDEVLEFFDSQIAILVFISFLPEVLREGFSCSEFVLQVAIDFDHLALDDLQFVLGHLLRVQDDVVVVEDVLGCCFAEKGGTSTRNAARLLGHDSFIGLEIVVELTQVHGHVDVVDLAGILVLEFKKVFVKFLSLLLHCFCYDHAFFEDFHEVTRLSLVRFLGVLYKQVFGDVLKIVLDARSPLVAHSHSV